MAARTIRFGECTLDIHYDIVNMSGQKDIIFLHGWGSSKEIMKRAFEDKFQNLRHIYIDMPGFGKSPNNEILTTNDYANIMATFLDALNSDKFAIVGHSFGGKVATLLKPKNLILLSSAGIPQAKSLSVKLKIAVFKLLKPLGFSYLYRFFATKDAKGMPKNMYETLKNVVDEDFSHIFTNYHDKTFIFWGKDDTATPLRAGEIIASLVTNNVFTVLDGNHYFFLDNQNAQEIEKICLEKFSS